MARRAKPGDEPNLSLSSRLVLNARASAEQFKQEVPDANVGSLELSFRIRGATAATYQAFIRYFAQRGITSSARLAVLHRIYFAEGGILTQTDLGRLMTITPPSVSYLVNGLEDEGYITRRPDPENRRATFVELTDKGRRICQQSVPEAARFTELLCQDFTEEELGVLNEYLDRLQRRAMTLAQEKE